VNVGSVIDDLVFRDRWRILILVPKKVHALGNVKSIQHLLIGHRSPSYRKIDWHQARSWIESVNSRVQYPRIEGETRQRFEMKIAEIEYRLVTRQINLRWVRSDQYPRLIRNRPVQKPVSAACTGDRQQDENLFHKALPNLRLVEEQFWCYFWSSKQMTFEASRRIPANHPSLAGHFPNAPIAPGVVVLDEVAAALVEWRNGSRLIGIPFVKFLAPIQPGQLFTIAFDVPENAQIDFCCRVDGRVVVEGRLEISCGACL
jgi:3-hydroxyacyl-[acyl-carrier-protein] dehydratase